MLAYVGGVIGCGVLEPCSDTVSWSITEQGLSLADVCLGMAHIGRPKVTVYGSNIFELWLYRAGKLANVAEKIIECCAVANGNVVNLIYSVEILCRGGE